MQRSSIGVLDTVLSFPATADATPLPLHQVLRDRPPYYRQKRNLHSPDFGSMAPTVMTFSAFPGGVSFFQVPRPELPAPHPLPVLYRQPSKWMTSENNARPSHDNDNYTFYRQTHNNPTKYSPHRLPRYRQIPKPLPVIFLTGCSVSSSSLQKQPIWSFGCGSYQYVRLVWQPNTITLSCRDSSRHKYPTADLQSHEYPKMHFLEKLHLVGIIKPASMTAICIPSPGTLRHGGCLPGEPQSAGKPDRNNYLFRELVRHLFPALRVTSGILSGEVHTFFVSWQRQPSLFVLSRWCRPLLPPLYCSIFCHHRGTLTDNGVNISFLAHRQVCFIHSNPAVPGVPRRSKDKVCGLPTE